MTKFLRKYQKFLLVIFASALMVVFVAPQAITQYGKGLGKRTEAYIGDRSVSTLDLQQAARQREAMQRFLSLFGTNAGSLQVRTGENALHWLMLSHSAKEGGFVGEAGDGQAWINELTASYADYMEQLALNNPDLVLPPDRESRLDYARAELDGLRQNIARNSGLSVEEFNLTLANGRGIDRMLGFYQGAPRLSLPAAMARAKFELDDIDLEYVFIPGDRAFEGEIDEAQLQAHFAKYQDVAPGEGEFGVGYVRPKRVKFETITLEREAIRDVIPITAREKINEYQNSGNYITEFDESLSDEDQQAARQAEYAKAENALRDARAQELMDFAEAQAKRLVLPTISRDANGMVELSAETGMAGPTLPDLAEQLQSAMISYYERQYSAEAGSFQPPLPRVNVYGATWRTLDELRQIPELGVSSVQVAGNRQQRFADFVMSVRELNPDSDAGPQQGVLEVERPVQNTFAGTLTFIRVLDVRDESPAESLDEVREQAEDDLRSIMGYQSLRSRVNEFQALAISEGLESVGALFNEQEEQADESSNESDDTTDDTTDGSTDDESSDPDDGSSEDTGDDDVGEDTPDAEIQDQSPPKPPILVQRDASVMGGLIQGRFGTPSRINEPELVEALEQLTEQLDPTVSVQETPVGQRTIGMALPKRLGVAVVQIGWVRPLTIERYRSEDGVAAAFNSPLARISAQDAFSFETMVRRLDVRNRDGTSPLEDDDEDVNAG